MRLPKATLVLCSALVAGCLPDYVRDATDDAGSDDGGAIDLAGPAPMRAGPGAPLHDQTQDITVNALIPTYQGTSIASLAPQLEKLPMPMNHQSTQVADAAFASCGNCHINAGAGSYYPGNLHSSLANLAQPAPTACLDCHSTSMPTGFVGPTAAHPVRTPASGEMKHDAVTWANGQPTTTRIVTQDCALCHASPTQALAATWATSPAGNTPVFHASLTGAAQPQPGSCVDCHANTRPSTVLTSANATLPVNLQFDHATPAAAADCNSCHVTGSASQWSAWSGAKFHAPGSATPSTCLPCHAGERPATTAGWLSATFTAAPFDYGTNALGITHGDGQDCAGCHATTQTWVGGHFTHGPATVSKGTCIACHASQRPDLQPGTNAAAMATLLGFDHSINGTGDCFGCHQATVAANKYATYTVPGGDWKGAVAYPGSTLASSSTQFITVTEISLRRSGANNLVTSMSSSASTLYNQMLHVSTALPAALNAGPTNNPDATKCWHCHTNTNGVVTAYANGQYHASLTRYSATPGGAVVPFPQPTSLCSDCHVNMQPAGIVEKAASNLQPMDHVAGAAGTQCAVCHRSPGGTWTDGLYHANIGATVPGDCTTCHYPLMADTAKSDLTSGTRYKMTHPSAQLTFQSCKTCHTGALAKATTTPASSTLWIGGVFHPSVTSQPTACLDCHAVSKPMVLTQSSIVYNLALGGTATNGAQWMNHGSLQVGGTDCAACHSGDAKSAGSAWSKSTLFHAKVAAPSTCRECHTGNLPSGLTNSTLLTSASNDATTGVPAGTHDQINHADINVSGADCKLCHTQAGMSGAAGAQGQEWAQAKFHASFGAANPLVMNGTTGRCSSCHMNVKPGAGFTGFNHAAFSSAPGTQDCSACHSWPGTGTATAPNWLGAAGQPQFINVGGFAISQPPAATATTQLGIANLPHPTVAAGTACTTCHASAGGGKNAIGYDHASALINANCKSCHEAGSNLVGTPWNNVNTQATGAGDTRPYTLTSVVARKGGSLTVTYPNHFYPVDCHECHNGPTGVARVSTGAAYTTAWSFPHTQSKMTNPTTCRMCHVNGIP